MLQSLFTVRCADIDREGLLENIKNIHVLFTRLRNRIDAEVLEAAPNLRFIVTNTTGLGHIDLAESAKRNVRVISLRGETDFLKEIRATAELTLALMLALVRHLPAACEHAKRGNWNRDLFQGNELYDKTVGVVGYGRLGQIVARYFAAMDMKVLVTDPHMESKEIQPDIKPVSMRELLYCADIVTIHVNLCNSTQGFFGRDQFSNMKKGAWFVNTARGELIDEHALLAALKSGRLTGAALDVLSDENPEDMKKHRLIRYAQIHDNLILTPHIGGNTIESSQKTELFLVHKLLDACKK